MRFFMYTLGDENVPMPPPTPELMAEMGAFMEEATRSGAPGPTPRGGSTWSGPESCNSAARMTEMQNKVTVV